MRVTSSMTSLNSCNLLDFLMSFSLFPPTQHSPTTKIAIRSQLFRIKQIISIRTISHEVSFYQFDIFDCLVISGQWSRLGTRIFGFFIVDYPKGSRLPFNNNDILLVYRSLFKIRFKCRYPGFGWRVLLLMVTNEFKMFKLVRKSLVRGSRGFADFQFFKGDPLTDFREVGP